MLLRIRSVAHAGPGMGLGVAHVGQYAGPAAGVGGQSAGVMVNMVKGE